MSKIVTFVTERPTRTVLFATAALMAIYLVMQLLGRPDEPPIELAQISTSPSPPPVFQPPASPAPAVQPPPAPAAAPPAELGTIVLRGVVRGGPGGGAAIFDAAAGTQRLVRLGQEIVAGIVLRSVGPHHAIASSSAGDVRLELGKSGAIATVPSGATVAAAPSSKPSSNDPRIAKRETMQFRLGLEPVKSGGQFVGYAVKPGAQLPHLGAAGVQPGDLILSVNGSQLDEERLMELSWQIANSDNIEIEYSRGGKRYKKQLNGNN